MIHFHKLKYPEQNLLITIPQAVTYFIDAEDSEDPISLKAKQGKVSKNLFRNKLETT